MTLSAALKNAANRAGQYRRAFAVVYDRSCGSTYWRENYIARDAATIPSDTYPQVAVIEVDGSGRIRNMVRDRPGPDDNGFRAELAAEADRVIDAFEFEYASLTA